MNIQMRKWMMWTGILLSVVVLGKEDVQDVEKKATKGVKSRLEMKFGSDCDPATQSADLDVNNVRTKILNGGDMWWDLSSARYEIPKIEDLNTVRKNSLFAGAIWIGGLDVADNLRLAAMTYRQRGSDFWPGPLDKNGNTNNAQCAEWDKIYKVDGSKIIEHVAKNGSGIVDDQIDGWPGRKSLDENPKAPFKDVDSNGIYTPSGGDYPILRETCKGIKIDNDAADQPDQMLWWIYNDNGNIHSETQADAMQIEIQTTAFAFATNDEINDMTFYTTSLINRGANQLTNTYFGQWVDADLGNYSDDYVGCDVNLSLGFCYNGDDNDEGVLGYGLNPPSVGVDFFEGPTIDTTINGVDTSIELGLSKFVFYNNDQNQINGNPFAPSDFYNYLQGKWRTGADIQYGGDGNAGTDGTKADYMFPGKSDSTHTAPWTEEGAGNLPADRRFLQSSGPFILKPGAVQNLTVGVVWARAPFGGASGSLSLLKEASKKAQSLFNSCFDLIDGPDAPDVEVHEQDQQIILSLGNTNTSLVENYTDSIERDFGTDIYKFQGYRVFQLKNGSVSLSQLSDLSKAREIFQVDLEDNFDVLINQEFSADVGTSIPVLKVRGENKGLAHTVQITEDEFATGSNKTLVNFKTYYYIVLAYAAGDSESEKYLGGRRVKKFSASPHKLGPKFGGSSVPSFYGDGPELTRLSGKGNGNNELELTQETKDAIMANNFVVNPKYENGFGPVKITVIDPLKVPEGDFELSIIPTSSTAELTTSGFKIRDSIHASSTTWVLVKLPNDTIFADTTLAYKNEQVILESTTGKSILDWGLAVTIEQVAAPSRDSEKYPTNGLINWSVEFSDPSNEWLTAVRDRDATQRVDGFGVYDWIRSGEQGRNSGYNDPSWHDFTVGNDGVTSSIDKGQSFERIWDGRIAPQTLVSNTLRASTSIVGNPRPETLIQPFTYYPTATGGHGLMLLSNVDIVLTPDESKWTECVMLEMGEDARLNIGEVPKFNMRKGQLKYGSRTLDSGKSIFPGYAINVNTGERLNIIIGEDSYQRSENGRDMKWNPTDNAGNVNSGYPSFGGRHFIYVMGSHQGASRVLQPKLPEEGPAYDKGASYYEILKELDANTSAGARSRDLSKIFQNCDWVIPAYAAAGVELTENADGLPVPPNEVTIRLRVNMPYGLTPETDDVHTEGLPKYSFSTADIANKVSVEKGKEALELVNIVPNPYYAFSSYESSSIDNRVKFTNLPPQCDISIYTLDGSLVRRIRKDDQTTEADWNLKNGASVPISSGMYIIHIDAGELGEKVLKWMGVMRELDLDSF